MARTPLDALIRRRLRAGEAMSVHTYMDLCLADPEHGYYRTRDPLGRDGDFVTAPEISQMFGELIGLWAANVWQRMGEPDNVRLVELGPGRGTLMADALRAAKVLPGFNAAIVGHLVETSPVLKARQQETLAESETTLWWHESLDEVPPGPAIVIANEFVDALPVHQAVRVDDGWRERIIVLDDDGALAFGAGREPIPLFSHLLPATLRDAPVGSIFEWRSDRFAQALAQRLVRQGGAALLIDYGHAESALGDTFQAVAGHAYADPLVEPGERDLTAHVDFAALARAAQAMGAGVSGPVPQGQFLRALGLEERAEAIKTKALLEKYVEIDTAVDRLTGEARGKMGALFKALGIGAPALGPLPGFEG